MSEPTLVIPEGVARGDEPFEQRSAPCPLCKTVMTTTAGGIQGLQDHLERCQAASDEDRAFYRKHRRWPRTAEQRAQNADSVWLSRQEKRLTDWKDAKRREDPPNEPLKCPGRRADIDASTCGLDISNGGQVHPRDTDCEWGKRYWRARDAREASNR